MVDPARADVEILGCLLPEDRRYDLEQEVWWLVEDGEPGTARIGVIASLAAFAGRFERLTFRPAEPVVRRGRSVATLESVRYTGAVRAPLDMVVLEQNLELRERPRLVNDDPYGAGWVVRVRAVDPNAPRSNLETAELVAPRLADRIRAMRIRCWPAPPDLELYEIGLECSAVLTQLNEELARRPAGDVVLLVTDDPTSPIEMERWADQTGHSLLVHRAVENLHHFLVRKEADPHPRRRPFGGKTPP